MVITNCDTEKLYDLKEGKGSEIGDSVVPVVQSCSYKFCKIHRKSPVLEVFFNEAASWRLATLLKRDSCTGVFP